MNLLPIKLEERVNQLAPKLLGALEQKNCSTMAETLNVMVEHLPPNECVELLSPVHALHLWRESRTVYSIDPALAEALCQQAQDTSDTEVLPSELLLNLPHRCIAVEMPEITFKVHTPRGDVVRNFTGKFFVFSGQVFGAPDIALQSVWATPDSRLVNMYLPILPGKPLRASYDALGELLKNDIPKNADAASVAKTESKLSLIAAQIVLYLQSQNADVRARPAPKKNKKNGKKSKPAKIIDTGFRYGSTIRAQTSRIMYQKPDEDTQSSERSPARAPVRPHMRRGHFHHFWVGPRDGERKLILKWVAPTAIHPNKDTETTIHRVKG